MRIARRFYLNHRSSKPQFINCTATVTSHAVPLHADQWPISLRVSVTENDKRATQRMELSAVEAITLANMLLHHAKLTGVNDPRINAYLAKVPT